MSAKTIPEKEYDSDKHVKEFKRKCNNCGKVWHVLESREHQIEKNIKSSGCDMSNNCCNPAAQLQAKRNLQASESELDKLKKCPECNSANYKEEVVIYERKR